MPQPICTSISLAHNFVTLVRQEPDRRFRVNRRLQGLPELSLFPSATELPLTVTVSFSITAAVACTIDCLTVAMVGDRYCRAVSSATLPTQSSNFSLANWPLDVGANALLLSLSPPSLGAKPVVKELIAVVP